MKRAHRRSHQLVWIGLPVLLFATLWLGFSIHNSETGEFSSVAPGVSE